jgi:hypothetical protein
VKHGVCHLGPPSRLQIRQQLKPPGVEGAVVHPAQRHHAVGVIAAAQRPRREVRRSDAIGLLSDDAPAPDDLVAPGLATDAPPA